MRDAYYWDPKKKEDVPFNPNTQKVSQVLEALKALCRHPQTSTTPSWLDPNWNTLATDYVAMQNGRLEFATRPHTASRRCVSTGPRLSAAPSSTKPLRSGPPSGGYCYTFSRLPMRLRREQAVPAAAGDASIAGPERCRSKPGRPDRSVPWAAGRPFPRRPR